MARYIIKRVILAIVTIFIVITITFFAMNAIPGGPFNKEKATTPAVQAILEKRYNFDKSVPEQFVIYLGNLVQGDFGVSLNNGRDITETLFAKFQKSATLGGLAALVAVFFGLIFGSIAALTRNRLPDRLIIFFSTLASAVPSFVLATLLLLVFSVKLGWVQVWSADKTNYVLPVIALAAYPMAYITRLAKTSMLDALGQDYVRTARAKGVAPLKVIFKHALRNSLIPVVTYVGPMLGFIITGSLVVESIYTIGGLGAEFIKCITNRDYPMIMATTIFLAVIMVLANLITDLVYKAIDPRIKFD